MSNWVRKAKSDISFTYNPFKIFPQEEFIEILFDFETKSAYAFKGVGYNWMNEKKKKKLERNISSLVQLLISFYLLFQIFIYGV